MFLKMATVTSRPVTSDPEEGWVEGVTHGFIEANGIRHHYVEAGEGPLVLLLHGFPDFWYSWRHQIPALAQAGFRVVTPDLRGYNRSDQPPSVSDYAPEVLAADVKELIHALGEESAVVAGHDWGGGVAWYFAMWHPEALDRLVILNCPHPKVMRQGLAHPSQLAKSWYMFFFQLPRIPELALGARGRTALLNSYKKLAVSRDAFTELDIERYLVAADRSDNLRGGINYYRAVMRRNPFRLERSFSRIDKDMLLLWGEKDGVLGPELTRVSGDLVRDAQVRIFPGAGHWVHLDDPAAINEELIRFLTS